jgi:hypothetical protein
MKVLLDTNVWRYVFDSGRGPSLYSESKRSGFQVTICPAVVLETLRIGDNSLRKKLIEFQTRRCWMRLMPDAFLECEEIKAEIRNKHPEWVLKTPNDNVYRKLKRSWTKSGSSWWEQVRNNLDSTAGKLRSRDDPILNVVRQQHREWRNSGIEGKKSIAGNWLPSVKGSIDVSGETIETDGWRVYASTIWANMLHGHVTAREWFGCHIDIDRMIYANFDNFTNFWLHEVAAEDVPRAWLRAAIFAMQGDRKVTDGNPLDQTIGVHLVDVDLVVSADRNFVSMIKRCHDEAPFKTADAFLISGGEIGIDELFELFAEGVKTKVPH